MGVECILDAKKVAKVHCAAGMLGPRVSREEVRTDGHDAADQPRTRVTPEELHAPFGLGHLVPPLAMLAHPAHGAATVGVVVVVARDIALGLCDVGVGGGFGCGVCGPVVGNDRVLVSTSGAVVGQVGEGPVRRRFLSVCSWLERGTLGAAAPA